jgi:hypothetical protein
MWKSKDEKIKENKFLDTLRRFTSQTYKLHGFVPNPYEVYCFVGLYCFNTNVMHYLHMKVMCMIFVCKQHE